MNTPAAPESTVRIAWAADAEAIARVQVDAWRSSYQQIFAPEVLAELDIEDFTERWQISLGKPADARNRALVAIGAGDRIVGIAATGPSEDPDSNPISDGEIHAFHVESGAQGQGHGSRLLQASIDTLRADGFTRAVIWLFSTDDAMRGFLEEAGWAPDGAHRELQLAGGNEHTVKQVRLHCSIAK